MSRRLATRITWPFQFAPGTRTTKRDGWDVLRAYDTFRRRIDRNDPRLYPRDYQPVVAVGEENLPMTPGELAFYRMSYADFDKPQED